LISSLRFDVWREANTANAIGPRYSLDQLHHMLRDLVGRTCQGDTQPIAYFLADGGTANGVDFIVATNSWAGHEIFPVSRGWH
jgi:hypothetical protein